MNRVPVQPETENEMNRATARWMSLPIRHGGRRHAPCPALSPASWLAPPQYIQTLLNPYPEYGLH